jgi:hypothetical protein
MDPDPLEQFQQALSALGTLLALFSSVLLGVLLLLLWLQL